MYESHTVSRPAEAVLVLAALSAGRLVAQEPLERERTVAKVSFEGNRAVDDYTLGISISTSGPRGFFLFTMFGGGERQPFDEAEFRRDVLRVQLLYRRFGYFEARVDTVVRRTGGSGGSGGSGASGGSVRVTFRIVEGPPVILDSVVVIGVDSIMPPARLVRRLPLREGRPFNRFAFDYSADTIAAALRDRGYPFPEIFRSYTVDRVTRLARAEFEVVPGAHARVGAVSIAGSRNVTSRTIRRALGVKEGDEFSQRRLLEGQLALYRSDLFRYASVGVHADSPLVGGVDSLVRVSVQIADAPRARLRAGAGYGTVDCGRTSATFTWANFTGGARRLEVTSRVSKIGAADPFAWGLKNSLCAALAGDRFSDRINFFNDMTITQPALLGRRLSVSVSLFAERSSEFNAYERVATGGVVSMGVPVGRVPLTLAYRLERRRTRADDATFCIAFDQCDAQTIRQLEEYRRQATLSLSVSDARTNSPLDPSQGRVYSAQVASAQPAFGSEVAFTKVLAEAAWYRSLGRGWVAAFRVRGGAVRAGDVTVRDSAGQATTIRFIPPSERFYAGGPTSVRGFGRNAMGPIAYVIDTITGPGQQDTTVRSSALGSNGIALANVELRAPSPILPRRFGFSLFVDAGQLWEDTPGGLAPSGVRVTPGMGLRIATPLGPMRLDVAYNRYPNTPGRLYRVVGNQLNLISGAYAGPPRGTGLGDRLMWHFSVGQAF